MKTLERKDVERVWQPKKSRAQEKLVIWGASGHAQVVAEIAHLSGQYEIVGYLDNLHPQRKGESFNQSVILGGEEMLEALRRQGVRSIVFGFGDCRGRLKLAGLVKGLGFSLPVLIHPKAVIFRSAVIGRGTVVAAGAVINSNCRIGESVIINTCATVGHDSTVDDGVHVCPGVNIASFTTVGKGTWVGIGATVIHRIRIGQNVMIGAGAVVVRDIPDGVVAYGVPAKVIRAFGENESYE